MSDTVTGAVHTAGLLPCPFCGSDKARTLHIRDGRMVSCICGARGKPEFHGPLDKPNAESRAIAAWNTRAVSAAEGDLLGDCLKLIADIAEWENGCNPAGYGGMRSGAGLALRERIDALLSQAQAREVLSS